MHKSPTSAKNLFRSVQDRLSVLMPAEEADQQAYWLLEALFSLSRTDVIVDKGIILAEEEEESLSQALQRLEAHEPIQYVTGYAPFYGRMYQVDRAVLIPRPETEELVHRIVSRHGRHKGLRVLDVGAGSGCIGISLSLELPESEVWAIDISDDALTLARHNAESLQAHLQLVQANILKDEPEFPPLDVLVSNPPYVRRLEAQKMQPNVLNWEPHLALFVEDEDPLLFYRRIASLGTRWLKAGAWLYFEINEAYGSEVLALLKEAGYQNATIFEDMQGKDRMVEANWPGL